MKHCTGLIGKVCTCGQMHTVKGDTGWTAAQFLTALFAGVCAVLAIVAALDN